MHDAVVVDDDYDEDGGDGADDDAPPDHQHRRDIVAAVAAAGDRLFVQLPIIAQHHRYDDEASQRVNVYIYGGNAQFWVRPPPLLLKYQHQHLMLYAPEAVPAQVRW